MTKKFDPKKYNGPRTSSTIAGAPNISRLHVWSDLENAYISPARGARYRARKYVIRGGKRTRVEGHFDSLEAARAWQVVSQLHAERKEEAQLGLTLSEVIDEWRGRRFAAMAASTRTTYDKLIRLHFGGLMQVRIGEITPARIDQWLDELKSPGSLAMKRATRRSFRHELDLLGTILKYYEEYRDDPSFRVPIRDRHRVAADLNRAKVRTLKDITDEEFLRFHAELIKGPHGDVMGPMAVVQYNQALRISEAAGIYWEDVSLDWHSPEDSRLLIVRSVYWPRLRGRKPMVQVGFKNSKANGGIKNQPMFPATFETLALLNGGKKDGLVFALDGLPLSYRQIQNAYDCAFERAGLPYRGTHVMRHGGTCKIYNEVPDLEVASQLLGNRSLDTVQVYAKRMKGALTQVCKGYWREEETKRGCDWVQKLAPNSASQ
jgi:integrase